MTIEELIKELLKVPKSKRHLPIYVYDYEVNDNLEVTGVSLFDESAKHSKENMLSIDINSDFY